MEIKKNWKPMINIIGIMLIMMTAASVCAEDPIIRETQYPDDMETTDYTDDIGGTPEPLLIATNELEQTETIDIPDYENYTGDMLISPGPKANSEATTPFHLLLLGIIGAVVIISAIIIGVIKRK